MIIDGASSDSAGFLLMGLIFGALYALPFLLVYFGTFEELTERQEIPVTLRTLTTVFRNRSFRVHIGMLPLFTLLANRRGKALPTWPIWYAKESVFSA